MCSYRLMKNKGVKACCQMHKNFPKWILERWKKKLVTTYASCWDIRGWHLIVTPSPALWRYWLYSPLEQWKDEHNIRKGEKLNMCLSFLTTLLLLMILFLNETILNMYYIFFLLTTRSRLIWLLNSILNTVATDSRLYMLWGFFCLMYWM